VNEHHKKLLENSKRRYESIGRVYSPILNSYVYFTSEGYHHLIYKGNRKKRNVNEQCYKLELFGLVIPVLKNCEEIMKWRFSGEAGTGQDIQHYALVHPAGKKPVPIRVIIKRTGDGQFNFHSVMKHTKKPRIVRGS
jgi:hypothetical protein